MDFEYLKIVITIVLAIGGLIIAHYFTSKRDINNKRREIRLKYLIDSYITLTHEIAQRELTKENKRKLEDLLLDIQLYGNIEQVLFSIELSKNVAKGFSFDIVPLINSLRRELRQELKLKEIDSDLILLRFKI